MGSNLLLRKLRVMSCVYATTVWSRSLGRNRTVWFFANMPLSFSHELWVYDVIAPCVYWGHSGLVSLRVGRISMVDKTNRSSDYWLGLVPLPTCSCLIESVCVRP